MTTRTESSFDRWVGLSPWRATLVFAAIYVVLQPALSSFLHLVNGEPWMVTTPRDWLELAALAVAMGCIGGLAYHVSRRLPPRSWTRAWLEAGNAGLSVSCAIAWDSLLRLNWALWIAITIFSAVVSGIFLGSIFRIVANSIAASSSPLPPN